MGGPFRKSGLNGCEPFHGPVLLPLASGFPDISQIQYHTDIAFGNIRKCQYSLDLIYLNLGGIIFFFFAHSLPCLQAPPQKGTNLQKDYREYNKHNQCQKTKTLQSEHQQEWKQMAMSFCTYYTRVSIPLVFCSPLFWYIII